MVSEINLLRIDEHISRPESEEEELLYGCALQINGCFDLLRKDEVASCLDGIISSGRLTKTGTEMVIDLKERLWLQESPTRIQVAPRLINAAEMIRRRIIYNAGQCNYTAYMQGGFDGGLHHHILMDSTKVELGGGSIVLGIELPEYTARKGREPMLDHLQKMSLWRYLAPEDTIIFTIPTRPKEIAADRYYDWLVHFLGMYRNPFVAYAGADDDPEELKEARLRRAASPNHILYSCFYGLHTTDLLNN